jgi:outer membrane protein assembly factor BamB
MVAHIVSADVWRALKWRGEMTIIKIVGVVAILMASCCAQAEDWPCWRGAARNGISSEAGPAWNKGGTNGLPVLWKATVGKGFSGFAVAGGRAATMGNVDGMDVVWCFDAVKGTVIWKHSYPCELQPLSYEGGPGSTPAIAGNRVYSFSKSGDLFCLDAETGRVIWSKKFELWPRRTGDWKNTWRYAGSPLVMDGKLYLSVGEAGAAFDAASGTVLWQSAPGHPGYSSPVPFRVGNSLRLVFFSGHGVVGVEAMSGKKLWEIPWRTEWDMNAADPIVQGQQLFVSAGNHAGCALFDLSGDMPREIWRNQHLKTPMCGAVLWQGYLYGFNDSDLVCVAWKDGALAWSDRALWRGTVMVVDGNVFALGEKGKWVVSAASPKGFHPIAQGQLPAGRYWSAPALANGRLYVRNAQGDAVCLDLRAGSR